MEHPLCSSCGGDLWPDGVGENYVCYDCGDEWASWLIEEDEESDEIPNKRG